LVEFVEEDGVKLSEGGEKIRLGLVNDKLVEWDGAKLGQ